MRNIEKGIIVLFVNIVLYTVVNAIPRRPRPQQVHGAAVSFPFAVVPKRRMHQGLVLAIMYVCASLHHDRMCIF